MDLTQIDQQLKDLYTSMNVPVDESGSLKGLDSLGLIHLIDQIEARFSIRLNLVDLDPVRISQHSSLVEIVYATL